MKITAKQLQMLLVIFQDSQKNVMGMFSYDLETRTKLLNEILNQQSNEIIEVNKEETV